MKFEQIKAVLNEAGFQFIEVGQGLGMGKGSQCHLYQKMISGVTQTVQVIVDENNVRPLISKNVPEQVRDLIYGINNAEAPENVMKSGM